MSDVPSSTRIDGDSTGTVLVQTRMSEKETAVMGKQGSTLLLPASQISQYEREELKRFERLKCLERKDSEIIPTSFQASCPPSLFQARTSPSASTHETAKAMARYVCKVFATFEVISHHLGSSSPNSG